MIELEKHLENYSMDELRELIRMQSEYKNELGFTKDVNDYSLPELREIIRREQEYRDEMHIKLDKDLKVDLNKDFVQFYYLYSIIQLNKKNHNALDVFLFFCQNMSPATNYIAVEIETIKSVLKLKSDKTVRTAIQALEAENFIKTGKYNKFNIYFINPMICFKRRGEYKKGVIEKYKNFGNCLRLTPPELELVSVNAYNPEKLETVTLRFQKKQLKNANEDKAEEKKEEKTEQPTEQPTEQQPRKKYEKQEFEATSDIPPGFENPEGDPFGIFGTYY